MLDLLSISVTFLVLLLTFAVTLEAVTVNPLCPTNKIAPRRRNTRGDHFDARTFGAFYDLLGPQNSNSNSPGSLQEEPQNDESDDCGDIEDYDENDLSSVTPKLMRRMERKPSFNMLYQHFYGTTRRPFQTTYKYKPTRPPTGGYFGTNGYRPPILVEPSAHIKPVHENGNEPYITYRPGLVGAPNAQIIGATQVKPFSSKTTTHTPQTSYINYYNRVTTSNPQVRNPSNSARKVNRDPSILSSFIDLLFK